MEIKEMEIFKKWRFWRTGILENGNLREWFERVFQVYMFVKHSP